MEGKEIQIPGSERIIALHSGSKSFYIVTEFNLFHLSESFELIHIKLNARSRILSVLDEGEKVWVVQANGFVQLFDRTDFSHVISFEFKDYSSCFYSASIARINSNTIEIAFGTIFSGILITNINTQSSDNSICIKYTLTGHNGSLFDIKYHPDNFGILVSCSDDRSIKIWQRSSYDDMFKLRNSCIDSDARVWAIDIQGDRVAAVSENNLVFIWNLEGALVNSFQCDNHSKSAWSVSLSKYCEFVAIGSNDGSVIVHNLSKESQSLLKDYKLSDVMGSIASLISTPDGTCFVSTDSGNIIKISQDSIQLLGSIEATKKNHSSMFMAANLLYVTDGSDGIYVIDINSKLFEFTKLFAIETSSKISIKFANDSFLLLEAVDKKLYIFFLRDNTVKLLSSENVSNVSCVNFIKDELLIGTRHGNLIVFDSDFQMKRSVLISKNESLKSIRSNDNRISVVNRLGYEFILDSADLSIIEIKKVGKGTVEDRLGQICFASFYNQQFLVSDPKIGVIDTLFCGGGHRLWHVSSDDQQYCLAFMKNGALNVHNGYLDKIQLKSNRSHGKEIRCAHVIKDKLMLSGSEDGLLILREGLTQKHELRLTNTSIKCLTSCGNLIFTGGSNESIDSLQLNGSQKLIHLASCPKQIPGLETRVLCLDAIQQDDDVVLLLAGYSDASIRLFEYEISSKLFKSKAKIENVHQRRCVQQLRFLSSDSFISAGTDGVLQAWRYIDSIEPIWNKCLHHSGIDSLDLRIKDEGAAIDILTGGEDGHVVLTKIVNGTVEIVFTRQAHNSSVTGVTFYGEETFISNSIDRFICVQNKDMELQVKRTVISDISAITLTEKLLTVYGTGTESFNLEAM